MSSITTSSTSNDLGYVGQMLSPWKQKLFFFKRLPSCLWWGIRLVKLDRTMAQSTIPYSWRTQNPFQSIYFAAQMGAGEFATGILATLAIQDKGRISMLAVNASAVFTKKANSIVTFTCNQGAEVEAIVQKAVDTKEPQTITMTAIGIQENGEEVSQISITWSFKAK